MEKVVLDTDIFIEIFNQNNQNKNQINQFNH